MPDDITFNPLSAYGSVSWAAQRLGMSKSQFLQKRDELESEGFPKRDPITKTYHKGDVDTWINRRRRIQDTKLGPFPEVENRAEVNLDAL